MIPFLFVVLIIVATIALGMIATKKSKTASDFFVAGRSVSVFWNASAISGEYLSAASFMGVAGLIMKNGYDALWYPVGYAAGYLFLLLFIAGPLRRFGAYTIPDFAQGRFDSATFRKVAVTFVLFIGFFYTMPQMKGAGVTMSSILGWPYWAGILVVGSVITFNVALGGMKGITVVQAFQYWVKVFAISLPVFVLLSVLGHGTPNSATEPAVPVMASGSTVKVKGLSAAPANALTFSASTTTEVEFPKGAVIAKIGPARAALPGENPLGAGSLYGFDNSPMNLLNEDGSFKVEPGTKMLAYPAPVLTGDVPVLKNGKPLVTSAKIEFAVPTEVIIRNQDGSETLAAPNAPAASAWLNPFGPLTSKHGYPLLYTYSLIVALVCGTAGLPHILVRFYTNPDGRAAKRTTLWVMVMLGAFYVFTPVWGTMGRALMPALYAGNATDLVVIKLPTILESKLLGEILSGVTSAGAFAAFMSTFSGLLVSMSGAFAHDIYGKILRPGASDASRLNAFKFAAIGVGVVSMGLGLLVESFDIAMMVGWAFAIGAASYFPLLLLGAWWRGLTKYGAAAGMLLGGLLSLTAIVTSMLLDKKVLTMTVSPLVRSLLEQPAIWGVPLSILTMVIVSKMTAKSIPTDVDTKMLRLHAPEEMGLSKDYVA
ncbi:MAG: cation acetate symporter [Fimbriimonas sp.]